MKTAEDFGSQGERPLYPELLDYLAARFIKAGWDVKGLLKAIVIQRCISSGASRMRRRWRMILTMSGWRVDRAFRLPAEMIRDNALAAAGLLKRQVGGPPVNPYEMSEAFKPVTAGIAYRRSLYTNWRRTSPPPAMLAFDAPRRAVCSAKRERTDSPLQALILLNGVQYVEAARVLGETLYHEAKGDVGKMIEQGFLRCLSREPDARARNSRFGRLYREQLAGISSGHQGGGRAIVEDRSDAARHDDRCRRNPNWPRRRRRCSEQAFLESRRRAW